MVCVQGISGREGVEIFVLVTISVTAVVVSIDIFLPQPHKYL